MNFGPVSRFLIYEKGCYRQPSSEKISSSAMPEFVTDILYEEQWPNILNAVIDVLKQQGAQTVRVEFGFVFERDRAGQPSPDDCIVPISDLARVIERGLHEGTIEWNGSSDFRFAAVEIPLQFMLCNDADLHFSSLDRKLLIDLTRALSRCNVRVYDSGTIVDTDSC